MQNSSSMVTLEVSTESAAAVGHGVACVDAEIHQHLLDLDGIGAHDGEVGREDSP